MDDLILLNNFLGSFGSVNRGQSPFQFVTEVSSRIMGSGFVLENLKDNSLLNEPCGDLYLRLDHFPVFEEGNQLYKKFGQYYFVNFCWCDDGMMSRVVSESDLWSEVETSH